VPRAGEATLLRFDVADAAETTRPPRALGSGDGDGAAASTSS
jgi:hypothetical protein